MKHWAKSRVEKTTDEVQDFTEEMAYQATQMILRIVKDARDDVDFSIADIDMVIDFHG